MKKVTLRRTQMGDAGTFGVLEVDGKQFVTGELPWRDNHTGVSCVPAGTYQVKWDPSPKFGFKYELFGVPHRTAILIHAANHMGDVSKGLKSELNGCIALGTGTVVLDNQKAVTGSRKAVAEFEELMGGQLFEITILDEYLETGKPGGNVA